MKLKLLYTFGDGKSRKNFQGGKGFELGIRNEELEMKVAASPRIYGAMPEGLLIAGFPRIASLPLEGKEPRRGG